MLKAKNNHWIVKSSTTILFTFLSLVFVNCDKNNNVPEDILSSKVWNRAIIDLNSSTNPSGEVSYYLVSDCELDDSFNFKSDGTLVINRNENKCDPNEIQYDTLSYSIDRTNKELVIDGFTYTLLEESLNQIKYSALVPYGTSFGKTQIFLLQ